MSSGPSIIFAQAPGSSQLRKRSRREAACARSWEVAVRLREVDLDRPVARRDHDGATAVRLDRERGQELAGAVVLLLAGLRPAGADAGKVDVAHLVAVEEPELSPGRSRRPGRAGSTSPSPAGVDLRIIPSRSRTSIGLPCAGLERGHLRLLAPEARQDAVVRGPVEQVDGRAGRELDRAQERMRSRSTMSTMPVSLPPTASLAPSGEYSAAPKKKGIAVGTVVHRLERARVRPEDLAAPRVAPGGEHGVARGRLGCRRRLWRRRGLLGPAAGGEREPGGERSGRVSGPSLSVHHRLRPGFQ